MSIIDTKNEVINDLDEKTTEDLAAEANTLYQQTQAIGAIGIQMMADAGRRLIIIKERIGHGNWLDWCQCNLSFSARKAQNMMKLSAEISEKNGIFSKAQTFTNIEISKVYELLGAPEDVQKTVLENRKIEDMTVKEFKEEIRRLKAELEEERAREAVGQSKSELEKAESEIEELKARIFELEEQIDEKDGNAVESLKSQLEMMDALLEEQRAEVTKKEAQLKAVIEEAETRNAKAVNDAVENVIRAYEDELEMNGKKTEEAIEEERKKSDELLKAEVERSRAAIKNERIKAEEAQEELQKLRKKLESNNSVDVAEFKIMSDQMQKDFRSCMNVVERTENDDQKKKMKSALLRILNMLIEEIDREVKHCKQ